VQSVERAPSLPARRLGLSSKAALFLSRRRDHGTRFRFHHVSTDEVFGSLGADDAAFSETTAYRPNSPYSASKAAADHLVRAYHRTYGLQVTTSNCSNNYGPYQFPEKLIPLFIINALLGKPLPVYGDGGNRRDWLHVEDHCRGIELVLANGRVGETYNIGGSEELDNLTVIERTCAALDTAFMKHPELAERFRDAPAITVIRNEGRKAATVAAIAPIQPATLYPMKVAVMRTGPGVIWPKTTLSAKAWRVSQPCTFTTSVSICGIMTKPPPKVTDPTLKKTMNNCQMVTNFMKKGRAKNGMAKL
jgi:GDP-D-mannose dehydratase